MQRTPDDTLSDGDRRRRDAYFKEFVPGLVGYVVSIVVVLAVVDDDPSLGVRLLMLLALIPSCWSVRAIVRMIARADEMTRTIHLEAIAAGFTAAMIAALGIGSVGLPGDPGLFNRLGPWLIFSVGMATWAVSAGIRSARLS